MQAFISFQTNLETKLFTNKMQNVLMIKTIPEVIDRLVKRVSRVFPISSA